MSGHSTSAAGSFKSFGCPEQVRRARPEAGQGDQGKNAHRAGLNATDFCVPTSKLMFSKAQSAFQKTSPPMAVPARINAPACEESGPFADATIMVTAQNE